MSKFRISHQFENQYIIIIKIHRLDLPNSTEEHELQHWFIYEKSSKAMVKLWLRATDSSLAIEERFFEQGYLKFSNTEATYIEKFNAAQHKLHIVSKTFLGEELSELIGQYLLSPGNYIFRSSVSVCRTINKSGNSS
ncbi:MAG: hypothetical protein EOO20_17700 [Chryseobacterium sp.]|nr:MAG: hypothetical protein EOO20_17700 [Chryseobacterium sp.]